MKIKGLFLSIKNIISFCINAKLRIELRKFLSFTPKNTDEFDRNHLIPLSGIFPLDVYNGKVYKSQ